MRKQASCCVQCKVANASLRFYENPVTVCIIHICRDCSGWSGGWNDTHSITIDWYMYDSSLCDYDCHLSKEKGLSNELDIKIIDQV